MFRKMRIALCAVAILGLLGSGMAFAKQEVPSWEIAFDPGPYMADGDYNIWTVEEYKGNLYIVSWGIDGQGGRIFRSPDGKNWEAVTRPASDWALWRMRAARTIMMRPGIWLCSRMSCTWFRLSLIATYARDSSCAPAMG